MMEQHEPKLLSQGAEGKVYESTFLSRHCVIKERVSKRYRVRELDLKINKQRLLQEVRCMVKCRKAGILTPSLFLVDQQKHTITMEFIEGRTLKDILRSEAASGMFCILRNYDHMPAQFRALERLSGSLF